jgi:hypothetical protein
MLHSPVAFRHRSSGLKQFASLTASPEDDDPGRFAAMANVDECKEVRGDRKR